MAGLIFAYINPALARIAKPKFDKMFLENAVELKTDLLIRWYLKESYYLTRQNLQPLLD